MSRKKDQASQKKQSRQAWKLKTHLNKKLNCIRIRYIRYTYTTKVKKYEKHKRHNDIRSLCTFIIYTSHGLYIIRNEKILRNHTYFFFWLPCLLAAAVSYNIFYLPYKIFRVFVEGIGKRNIHIAYWKLAVMLMMMRLCCGNIIINIVKNRVKRSWKSSRSVGLFFLFFFFHSFSAVVQLNFLLQSIADCFYIFFPIYILYII